MFLKEYAKQLIKVEEQDDNDQTKAMCHILEHYPEVDCIHILAATGKREDHTIGNLGLLMEYARRWPVATGHDGESVMPGQTGYPEVDMVSDYSTAFTVTDTCDLILGKGRRISIFSPDNSLNIKSQGLVWPTDEVVFDNWWPATLNRTSEDLVHLEFSHKSLVLIITD